MKMLFLVIGLIISVVTINHYINPPYEPPIFTEELNQIICIQEELDC